MQTLIIAFVVSLTIIVTATIGLEWTLDGAEISVIVFFVLLGTITIQKLLSRRKGENQDAKTKGSSD